MKDPKTLFRDNKFRSTIDMDKMMKDIVEEIFKCSGEIGKNIIKKESWKIFWNKKFNPIKDTLGRLGHFYYFICKPYIEDGGHEYKDECKWEEDYIRDEIRLIGVTSLIEKMMEEEDHKVFFTWFEKEFPKFVEENRVDNYSFVKEKYLNIFGTNRKVKRYFNTYLNEEDKEMLKRTIKKFNGKTKQFEEMNGITAIADFLYRLRNQFVHNAKMVNLCPPYADSAGKSLEKKFYNVELTIRDFLHIFQRSFASYWEEKIVS